MSEACVCEPLIEIIKNKLKALVKEEKREQLLIRDRVGNPRTMRR